MANIRTLKKTINAISDELIGECLVCLYFMPEVDKDKVVSLVDEISGMRAEYLSRVGKCGGKEPKMVKTYYRSLIHDYSGKVAVIVEELNKLDK